MSTNPFSQWLAMNKSTMAMYKQLAQAGDASVQAAASQLPAGQAQLAQLIKSTLDMGKQWKHLQADAFTSLMHVQLDVLKSQQQVSSLQTLMELQQSLASELSSQRDAVLKQVAERVNAGMDDLRKAADQDEMTVVVGCLFEDMGKQLRSNAEQTFTTLNAAAKASVVLTHKALDDMAGKAPD